MMTHPFCRLTVIVAAILLCPAPLHPQTPTAVPIPAAGDTVRLTLRTPFAYAGSPLQRQSVGVFLGMSADTVRFQPEHTAAPPSRVVLGYVDRIETPGRRHSRALSGFLGGAAFGFLGGVAAVAACGSWVCSGATTTDQLIGGAAAAVVVGGIGAAIGAFSHSRGWQRVPLDSLTLQP